MKEASKNWGGGLLSAECRLGSNTASLKFPNPEYRSVGIKANSVGDPAFLLLPWDENPGSSAVAECKPYGLPRVTDLPKAIKKKKFFMSYFSLLFLPGSSISIVIFRNTPLLTH